MTHRKTLRTKPPKITTESACENVSVALHVSECARLLLSTAECLFKLADELGYKWDREQQKWLGLDK